VGKNDGVADPGEYPGPDEGPPRAVHVGDVGRRGRNRTRGRQKVGNKGANTRRLLIDATAKLTEAAGFHKLSVADIVRYAGVSQATFYVYFENLNDAALAVLDDLSQSTPHLLNAARRRVSGDHALENARVMVDAYFEYYQQHRALFLARNLAADSGDDRFVAARMQSVAAIQNVFAERIREAQAAGRLPAHLHPQAVAGLMLSLLERLGATASLPPQAAEKGIKPEGLKDAAAFVLATLLDGRTRF
jgi:AcrR family transcriptional regulator